MANLNFVFVLALIFVGASAQQHDHHDHAGHNHEEHRVNVAVYYESLCPDSKKFFTQQLYPSLQGNLSKFVNLTLVPYGKTTTSMVNNNIEFSCHHGPGECQGNKIQACALHMIDNGKPTEGLGFNRVAVGFINCLMDKSKRNGDEADFPSKHCAELNHVSNLHLIENCVNHTDASNYLSNYGRLTDALQKPLNGVPTVVFNKEFKEADNTLAFNNFVKALCQYIPKSERPYECSTSGAAVFGVSFVFLILTTFVSRLI